MTGKRVRVVLSFYYTVPNDVLCIERAKDMLVTDCRDASDKELYGSIETKPTDDGPEKVNDYFYELLEEDQS